jgi:predicted PurR-regulated permease PerM
VLAGVELDGIAGIFIALPVVALVTVAARWLEWRERDAEPDPVDPSLTPQPVAE